MCLLVLKSLKLISLKFWTYPIVSIDYVKWNISKIKSNVALYSPRTMHQSTKRDAHSIPLPFLSRVTTRRITRRWKTWDIHKLSRAWQLYRVTKHALDAPMVGISVRYKWSIPIRLFVCFARLNQACIDFGQRNIVEPQWIVSCSSSCYSSFYGLQCNNSFL